METVFKIAITAVVLCAIYYQLVLVRTAWRSQIDPRATISRLLKKLEPENTLIATRDPKKIYQSGEAVGDAIGDVSTAGSRVTFKQLANTTNLRRDQPFEYHRSTYKIVSIASEAGMWVNMTDTGTQQGRDVLGDVV
jgi:hypothetical protein